MQLTVAHDMESLQQKLAELARTGKRVALVPTMGALHAGHMSLVERAKQDADAVVATIFVNPKQFGANEDFGKYPRMLGEDAEKLDQAGATLLYAPSNDDIYPEGYATSVSVSGLSDILCGRSRPSHFDGVATVVTKLLLRTLPHVAFFGEKDYQQLCILRRVVQDLDIPVEIVGVPIVREADGLAMSSRNAYLSEKERPIAPNLYATLKAMIAKIEEDGSELGVQATLAWGHTELTYAGFKLDYLELRAEDTLAPLTMAESGARLLAAVWLGGTRLIDNVVLK